MGDGLDAAEAGEFKPAWLASLAEHGRPDLRRAIWQLVNTLVPYLALWVLMVILVRRGASYWAVLALAVPAAALLVRVFIFFHDCCHGSFFASRRANTVLGYISGILTFTPFDDWRRSHATHHVTAGDLDRRGIGDVWTMTVDEYLAAPRLRRLAYRLFRHPAIMFGLGPIGVFLLGQRLAHKGFGKRARLSVLYTNLALLAIVVAASLTIGLRTYVLIQFPVLFMAGSAGIWLFYVQHQFEGVYWARHEAWDPIRAALEGSSYYRLPKVLQWLTGNIGLHHIHHLRPRTPNYQLQRTYEAVPEVRRVEPVTLRSSLKSLRMNLWDEEAQELISFRALRRRIRQGAPAG